MNKKEILKRLEEDKIDTLELIEILNQKDKYNLLEEEIWDVEDRINYQIEEQEDISKLENIKIKLEMYNMDNTFVNKIIKRRKPLKDSDINNFDKEEVEYYIYDGFDMLTVHQRLILVKKAKELKVDEDDIDYLIEQIEECNEDELDEQEYIQEENNSSIFSNIFGTLFQSNEKEKINNDYEQYQFEEEELEEDDYYYEDPD